MVRQNQPDKAHLFVIILILSLLFIHPGKGLAFETITFPSQDGLLITADLYQPHPETSPFLLLFHRAGWSRGEYREIAPKLNELGFNCLAIDQRSGNSVKNITNETAEQAEKKGLPTTYLDALQDMEAAFIHTRKNLAQGKLLLWGSSYSASLALVLANNHSTEVNGILAFAPGEYFVKLGKGETYVAEHVDMIQCPVFITSSQPEKERWWPIFQAIPSRQKEFFLPETFGIHGSQALWQSTSEHKEYWEAVKSFLFIFNNSFKN